MPAVVFVFLDGFGLDAAGPDNPLSIYDWPSLGPLLGAAPVLGNEVRDERRLLAPLDCRLGVEGLPQSATGQVSLFTGVNAAALLGFHLAAYPNARLRQVIDADNLLKRAAGAGLRATFANAYTPGYFERVAAGKLRHSATTLCVLAAGLRFRMLEDLERGEAVYWDVTNERLASHGGHPEVAEVAPEMAGERLAHLAGEHELTLYESFLPDLVGHSRDGAAALALMALLDRFIGACARALPPQATLVVCSDHGNIERLATAGHTANPVPLMVLGPGAPRFGAVRAITDVAPAVYEVLGVG